MVNKTKNNRILSVSGAVSLILEDNIPAKIALAQGYANVSALARILLPKVSALLGYNAGAGAVVTALKRLKRKIIAEESASVVRVIAGSKITVRTGIAKLSLARAPQSTKIVLDVLRSKHRHLVHMTEGLSAITIAVEEEAAEEVKKRIPPDMLLEFKDKLAAIVISSPPEISVVPGCLIPIYMKLYEYGINIEDTSSSYTDTIILVDSREASRAFTALNELIYSFRELRR